MSLPKATSRGDLIRRFRELGWDGPHSVKKHQFMRKGSRKAKIPNPHQEDVGIGLLKLILDHAGITAEEWNGTK